MKKRKPASKGGSSSEGSKDFVNTVTREYEGGSKGTFDVGEFRSIFPKGETPDQPTQEGVGYRPEDLDEDGDEIPGIPGFPSYTIYKEPEKKEGDSDDSGETDKGSGDKGDEDGEKEGDSGASTPGGRSKVDPDSPWEPRPGEGEESPFEDVYDAQKELEDLIDKYNNSHSANSDKQLEKELSTPEGRRNYEEWKKDWQKQKDEAIKRHPPKIPWNEDEKKKQGQADPKGGKPQRFGKHGYGLGGELIQIGAVTKPDRSLWKKLLKKFITDRIAPRRGSSWTRPDTRTSRIRKQLIDRGQKSIFKARNVIAAQKDRHKIGVMVDVSGSVFDREIQGQFRNILIGVPKDQAEVLIWTFDDGLQDGPMSPEKYRPIKGGGGTENWNSLKQAQKMVPDIRIWVFLTDGFIPAPPPGIIDPKNTAFVIPEDGSVDQIPDGCTIVHPYGWTLSNPEG